MPNVLNEVATVMLCSDIPLQISHLLVLIVMNPYK